MGSASNVLLIGVGGTGTKIVRKMLEGWKSDGGLPQNIAVAIIDAHDGTPEGGRRPEWTFMRSSKINFQKEYGNHYDKSASGLAAWWPSRVQVNSVVGFHHGCGATRANGRFFAFHYAGHIRDTIVRALDTKASSRSLKDAAPTSAINWDAFICMSAGNGTGAGNMLPVAAIVRQVLLERGSMNPRVNAVVVPASVTQTGNNGSLRSHVAAAGVAALLELQYECNRKSDGLRPERPYSHVGYVHGQYEVFRPWYGSAPTSAEALTALPYDNVFVLDRFNMSGVSHEYDEIVTAGAEGLRALMGGADQDNRVMDLEVRAGTDGRNFGSLGVMTFAAPTRELASWCAGRQGLAVLKDGARGTFDVAVRGDLDLLAERDDTAVLDLTKCKTGDDALAASVAFFVDHALEAREIGANDMFARFDSSYKELEARFNQLAGAASATTDAKDRQDKYASLLGVLDSARAEVAKYDSLLARDFDRQPANPDAHRFADEHDGAGGRWLIEARALSFLEQGKSGLGAAWLRALRQNLDNQRADIHKVEVKKELGDRLDVPEDGTAARELLEKVQREAGSFFAFLKSNAIQAVGDEFQSEAKRAFKTIAWQGMVKAVEAHYARLIGHANVLEQAFDAAARTLETKAVRAGAEKLVADADAALGKVGSGAKLRYLGVRQDVRDRLLASLDGYGAVTSREVVADSVSAELFDLVAASLTEPDYAAVRLLDQRRKRAGWPGDGRLEELGGAVVRRMFSGTDDSVGLEDVIRAAVRREGSVEELLVNEGREQLTRYYQKVIAAGGRGLDPAGEAVQMGMRATLPAEFLQEIDEELRAVGTGTTLELALLRPDEADPTQRVGALEVYVRARLFGMIGAARPLWRPVASRDELALVQRMAFFTFSQNLTFLRQVASRIEKEGTTEARVKVQAVENYPTDRIECVAVELGGKVEWILTETDIESYRKAMYNMPEAPPSTDSQYQIYVGFNPHSEKQYEEMGKRWLELRDERVAGNAGSAGAEVLVALGRVNVVGRSLLGLLEQRGNHFYLARDVKQIYGTDGRPMLDSRTTLPAGTNIGPAGVVDVTAWLEGKERKGRSGEEGKAFAHTLRALLWRDVDTWIRGDAEKDIPPVSLTDVCEALNLEAGKLRAERGDDARAAMIRSHGEALAALADSLRVQRGNRPQALAT